jgi:hypothetical protein
LPVSLLLQTHKIYKMRIIDYILEMKKQDRFYGVIAASIMPVKTYYQINGVTLNIKLIDNLQN